MRPAVSFVRQYLTEHPVLREQLGPRAIRVTDKSGTFDPTYINATARELRTGRPSFSAFRRGDAEVMPGWYETRYILESELSTRLLP